MTNRDNARNFSADAIRFRILRAIRPQLDDLRDLQKHHEGAARTERLRQRYRMFDATDKQVQWAATRDSMAAAGEVIGNAYKELRAGIQGAWDGIAKAFRATRDDFVPSSPVPAQDHAAADHTRRQYLAETRHAAHRAANN